MCAVFTCAKRFHVASIAVDLRLNLAQLKGPDSVWIQPDEVCFASLTYQQARIAQTGAPITENYTSVDPNSS